MMTGLNISVLDLRSLRVTNFDTGFEKVVLLTCKNYGAKRDIPRKKVLITSCQSRGMSWIKKKYFLQAFSQF